MVVKPFAHVLSSLPMFFVVPTWVDSNGVQRTGRFFLFFVLFFGVPSLPLPCTFHAWVLLDLIQSNLEGKQAPEQKKRVFRTFEMEFRQG